MKLAPSDFGKHEYLLHFAIGLEAIHNYLSPLVFDHVPSLDDLDFIRKNKDHNLATESFAKVVKLRPDFSPAYECLAVRLSWDGKFAEAFAAANKLIELVPYCADSYDLRG